jgi:serine protease Do
MSAGLGWLSRAETRVLGFEERNGESMIKTRLAVVALAFGSFSFLGGAIAGCAKPTSQPGVRSGDEHALNDASADRKALPPLHVADPLPPGPVPATFDVADLAEKVQPSVVNITTLEKVSAPAFEHPFDMFNGPDMPQEGQREGAGTGFIIDSNGYVVTNEHVVHDADEVHVKLNDEREFAADVVGRDPKMDIALLKLRDAKGLPAVRLGSSENLRVGESVVAVGNPFGLGSTVTLGIVSAKQRAIGTKSAYDDFIQTDAAINPGNSGGPLFNGRGEVVGVNTAIRPGANTIGFAIPIDAVKDVLAPLRETGHVVRGKLGLGFQPITPELAEAMKLSTTNGALVSQVEKGAAAARAGLREGDVIVSVNGAEIHHADELPRRVARNAPGSSIRILYVRDGKQTEAKATLDTLEDDADEGPVKRNVTPPPSSNNKLGIQVGNAPGGGAVIDRVSATSPLKEIMQGDVIVELDGAAIKDVDALQHALEGSKPGTVALAKIKRGDFTRFAAIPIPKN